MDSPLSQISSLMPLIEKIAADKAAEIFSQKLAEAQYSVPKVPDHHHTGVDSVQLGPEAITGFSVLPAVPGSGGVADAELLGGQIINDSAQASNANYLANVINSKQIYVNPVPIVFGSGTTQALTMTGIRPVGATTATLTGNWAGATGVLTSRFNSGEQRQISYTNGSASISWSDALLFSSGSTALTVIANSRFKGGEAPIGTTILFVNPDDGLRQVWFRADIDGEPIDKWYGMDFTVTAP